MREWLSYACEKALDFTRVLEAKVMAAVLLGPSWSHRL